MPHAIHPNSKQAPENSLIANNKMDNGKPADSQANLKGNKCWMGQVLHILILTYRLTILSDVCIILRGSESFFR